MTKFYTLTNKSFSEFGVATHKELWQKAQEAGYTALKAGVETAYEKAADNKFHFVFSTAAEDRHGDVVEQNWELARYRKNPVVIDSHNYGSIDSILGRISPLSVKDGKLQGDIEFATMNPRGALAEQMVDGGFLNATSVGFIPKEFNDKGTITRSELLEVSMVSVPANYEALAEKSEDTTADPPEDVNGSTTAPEQIEPQEDTQPSPVVPAPSTTTPQQDIYKNLNAEAQRQRTILNSIARELQQASPANLAEQKRRIFRQLREALQSQG